MSTIFQLFSELDEEIHQLYALEDVALRERINDLSLQEIVSLWKVDSPRLTNMLSNEIDHEVVSRVLEQLSYCLKAESLNEMSNERRQLIVGHWPLRKQYVELHRLALWQRIKNTMYPDGPGGFASIHIKMPKRMSHRDIDKCDFCSYPYRVWETFGILHCRRHSACGACLQQQEGGLCYDCDE